jgi:hypothetical protein
MSSTYLTSTLAGLVTALAVRRRPEDWQRNTATLLSIVAGATLGALTATWFPAWLPVVVITPASDSHRGVRDYRPAGACSGSLMADRPFAIAGDHRKAF